MLRGDPEGVMAPWPALAQAGLRCRFFERRLLWDHPQPPSSRSNPSPCRPPGQNSPTFFNNFFKNFPVELFTDLWDKDFNWN
jgi:hypothetical protein